MFVQESELDPALQILDVDFLRRYMFCGNKAELLLVSPSGMAHRYEVCRPLNSRFPKDVFFVYTISENKRFYTGMVEKSKFRFTENSRFPADTTAARGAEYLIKLVNVPTLLERTPMRVYHSGKCPRCGRKLTSKYGLKNGYGRKCMKIIEDVENNQSAF